MKNGTEQSTDIVVVGGGLAGLAAAAYAGRAGRSVTVLERSGHIGGRAITNDLDGFRFNLGPHALYRGGPAARVLAELGVTYTADAPLVRAHLLRNGSLHQVSMNPWHFMTEKVLSVRGKLAVGPALVSIMRTDPASVRDITVRAWLDGLTRHEDVRQFIQAFTRVTSYGNDPEHMSAEVAVTQLKLGARGVVYLDDGWQILVDGLRGLAEAAGARIVTNAKVATIGSGGDSRVVRLDDGTSIVASTVILATDPKTAASLTNEPALQRWAERAVPVRAACLDLGLSSLPRPRATFSLGMDEPLYFSVHSATARLAPEDAAAIHVAKYLPSDDATEAKETERELEEFVDLVQPGWRDVTVKRRFLPNLEVASALPTAADGGLGGRPHSEVSGVSNVYLAGDWVGPEGWLSDASLASAQRAAELAIRATGKAASPVAAGQSA